MIEGLETALAALAPQVGDYSISARVSKPKHILCDGQAVSRATYADLFAVIGTTFGVGDGSTTFNVPDPQGCALVFAGAGKVAESFASSSVTPATDIITVTANAARWITGMKVRMTSTGIFPSGLAAATDYFVIRVSATVIKLATSLANALAGTAIDIATTGNGTHTLTHLLTARTAGEKGGEEAHATAVSEMPSHRHKLYGDGSYGGSVITGLGDGGSRSVAGNLNTGGKSYIDTNQGAPLVENTGGDGAHNNMPPFLVIGNLFIYAGV